MTSAPRHRPARARAARIACAAGILTALATHGVRAEDASAAADGAARREAVLPARAPDEMTMDVFLDRLMMAESGGRTNARNLTSTALGPYQFIASTWLTIANRHFKTETASLRVDQILALRTDLDLARRAADIYTQENAAYLAAQGHATTFANLRLAFLVGAGGASRVLSAAADTPAGELLGTTVIGANPFMNKLTAAGLIARAARDISIDPKSVAGITADPSLLQSIKADGAKSAAAKPPRVAVACDLSLPSCRRWLALAERRVRKQRRASN